MDRFRELQVFVKVAEEGGFAAAARALAMSPPAVTRAVSALEERLQSRLLVRTTRTVRLTESGRRLLDDGRSVLSALEEAENQARGARQVPRGHLRITAPALFGCYVVAPALGAFLQAHDEVTAETLFVDRVVNVIEEGLDVAVRIGELPDSSLSAIRVGSVCRVVAGAPAYFEAHGMPMHPSDLHAHRLINPLAFGRKVAWNFRDDGKDLLIEAPSRLSLNTNDAILELMRRGWGISRLLSYQVAPGVAQGALQTVLDAYRPPPVPVHVVHPEGRIASAKVRAFVDFMVEELRQNEILHMQG
ncbi:LysR substrate-binding domain-containing protein [Nisaea acidiphila]|uniref:LysR substrate-binding domain-containing protein n=1 Tax=Nisaea acidiphila TaxID=1862145 RepID=A0A9J7AR54_9PROT|nr:LysR substrate-binding domain-containing protein [Nisaea acidiphila]UUX49856.1 LysR substrate-binding domain-containing protein [Nisaea acidiphila]